MQEAKEAVRPTVIELNGISKRFGGVKALSDIDWFVWAGEVHCLVGENGCGKSTLIKIISGVHQPEPGGRLKVGSVEGEGITSMEAKAEGVEVIFQDLALFPNLTVAENIAIDALRGSRFGLISRRKGRAAARKALAFLDVDLDLDAVVETLSVAERQLVAIARGIAFDARILFMDEPTASLTRKEVDKLFGIVHRLCERGAAVIFVSHRSDEVLEIAQRVTVLRDGRMVGTFPCTDIDERRLTELITGEAIEHSIHAGDRSGKPVRLMVEGLSRRDEYQDVSFEIREGEIVGLIGLLGAGRTELALSLFGLTTPDKGAIVLDGTALPPGNRSAIAAGIAYVSEDRLSIGLDLRRSIADNLSAVCLDRLAASKGSVADRHKASLAQEWVERLAIKAADVTRDVSTLSGGNQQRVVLAKWLSTEPRLLILDSPTVGVDVRNKSSIYALCRRLAANGIAQLMISDEVEEVYQNCDRILHMRDGRIQAQFVPGTDSIDAVRGAVYA